MSAINKVRVGNDDIYEASGSAKVVGGTLVVPHTGATNAGVQGIDTAGAAAADVLGVAARDAIPVGIQATTGTDADGFPFANPDQPNELTAVWRGCVVPVTYAAGTAVAFGQKLQSAASGEVTAYSDATGSGDPATIVGECRVVGGMGTGGGVGLALIY